MAGYGRIFSIVSNSTNVRNLLPNRNVLLNLQRCMALKARELAKLGIPPKPKRPLTPYFKFMSNERVKVRNENPNLPYVEIMKKIGQNWSNYDANEKEMLQKAYDLEQLTYSKQVIMYEQSITPEQKRLIIDAKNNAAEKAEKLKLKKKITELGKPKKPPTSFIQYLQERKFSKHKDEKASDWLRHVAEKWRLMSPEEKSKYENESKRLMEQYKNDMREWEEKMVRLGHIDVVRNRGLIDLKVHGGGAKTE